MLSDATRGGKGSKCGGGRVRLPDVDTVEIELQVDVPFQIGSRYVGGSLSMIWMD